MNRSKSTPIKIFCVSTNNKKISFLRVENEEKNELILLYYFFFLYKIVLLSTVYISPRYQTPNYIIMHLHGLSVDRSFASNRVIGCRMIHLTCALSLMKCF